KERGVTILFVSHSMTDVKKVCDKVIWVENHRLKAIGDADSIIDEYVASMA
ncbi:sugar ABC transporter ATP-binding protein, partial [Escherichia coli]|nr:sugar ABC transporter ATP-binding protein [Escherichia coli]